MFSPDATVHPSVGTRNPRRRQRTSSEDSVAIKHNPKRLRRSGLTQETFQPPPSKQVNGYVDHVEDPPAANGHATHPTGQRHASVDTTSLAIRNRGIKKADREKRSIKTDGSIELVYLFEFGNCDPLVLTMAL